MSEAQTFVVFKYSEAKLFRGSWKHVVMTCDSDKLSLYRSGQSYPLPPKSTFFLSRVIVERSTARENALKITDAETRLHVTIAMLSVEDLERLCQFVVLDRPSSTIAANTGGPSDTTTSSTSTKAASRRFTYAVTQDEEIFKVKNPKLAEIGRALEALEKSVDAHSKATKKTWKATEMPILESQIKEVEAQLRKVKGEAEKKATTLSASDNTSMGDIDEEINRLTETFKGLKTKHLFGGNPHCTVAVSDFDAGLFIACDEFWIEHIKGLLSVDLVPTSTGSQQPFIRIVVDAPSDEVEIGGAETALEIRLKVNALKIKGDTNSSIPTVKFNKADFTFKVKITLVLLFDSSQNKWIDHPSQCSITLVSFKGPFSNALPIQTIFSYAVPGIKKGIAAAIPVELGPFLAGLRSPFTLRVDFKVLGNEIDDLEADMDVSSTASAACGLSPTLLHMFLMMQRHGMKRAHVISSVADFVTYLQYMRRHEDSFLRICALWEEACQVFASELKGSVLAFRSSLDSGGSNGNSGGIIGGTVATDDFRQCFAKLVMGADVVLRKRLRVSLDWKEYRGEIPLNRFMILLHKLTLSSKRDALKAAKSQFRKSQINADIAKANQSFVDSVELYKHLCRNIDSAELSVKVALVSGANGYLRTEVKDIAAKLPLFMGARMAASQWSIPHSKIPYSLRTMPHDNGDFTLQWLATRDDVPMKCADEQDEMQQAFQSPQQAVLRLTRSSTGSAGSGSAYARTYQETFLRDTSASLSLEGLRDDRIRLQRQLLDAALSDRTRFKESTSRVIGEIYVQKSTMRAIVDGPITTALGEGSELFVVSMSDSDRASEPAALIAGESILPRDLREYRDALPLIATTTSKEEKLGDSGSTLTASSTPAPKCFTFVATAPNIKFVSTVPEVRVGLDLLSWFRITNDFFEDMHLLKGWIASVGTGFDPTVDGLALFQVWFTRSAKYIFKEGLHVDYNARFKLFKDENEVVLKMETPLPAESGRAAGASSISSSPANSKTAQSAKTKKNQYFFKIEFEFNYHDLLDDFEIIRKAADIIDKEEEIRESTVDCY